MTKLLSPLLFLWAVASMIAGFMALPVSAESPEVKCQSEGGAWQGNKCLGGTAESRCESIGAKWTATPDNTSDPDKTIPNKDKSNNGSCNDSTLDSSKVSAEHAQKARVCLGSGGVWSGDKCLQSGSITVENSFRIIINLLSFVIGLIAVVVIVLAGFRIVTSNGDSNQIAQSRKAIIYAMIGVTVAVAAYAIVNFILNALKV